ncbi:hypothetical protein EVA_19761 [gut metagenome]|uniref:Uncharacterized protein n=1 Tax=gut metagenome TaxID=749906 RepID=J9FB55_9ZZZZ
MVDEEMSYARNVATPGKDERNQSGCQHGPLHRTAYEEQTEDKEEAHDGTYIDRSYGTWLFAPVARDAGRIGLEDGGQILHLVEIGVVGFCRIGVKHAFTGTASLEVGNHQCKGLADAIAPARDIIIVQSIGRIGFGLTARCWQWCQFRLSTHRFLGIGIGMVDIAEIGGYAQDACYRNHSCSFQPLGRSQAAERPGSLNIVLLFGRRVEESRYSEGSSHAEHDEEEVVAHLNMVGENLQGSKQGHDRPAP